MQTKKNTLKFWLGITFKASIAFVLVFSFHQATAIQKYDSIEICVRSYCEAAMGVSSFNIGTIDSYTNVQIRVLLYDSGCNCVLGATVEPPWIVVSGITGFSGSRQGTSYNSSGLDLSPDTDYTVTSQTSNTPDGSTAYESMTISFRTPPLPPPPPTPATINVVEAGSCGTGGTWTVNPGGYTSASNSVSPGTYNLTVISMPAGAISNTVTSTDGGNSLNVTSGQTKQFTITYDCLPSVSAPTVALSANPASGSSGLSSILTWTVSGGAPDNCDATANPTNAQWNGGKSVSSSNQTITNITQTTDFTITCSNSAGSSQSTASVTVIGSPPPPNAAPTTNAGSDKAITLPTSSASVTDASASDSDGTVSSTVWSFVSGPATPTISSGNTLTPSFSDMTTAGTYTFRLTVTDNAALSSNDTMQVVVSDAVAGTAQLNVVENGASGGSWIVSPGGYSGSTMFVQADPSGSTYSIGSVNAPTGYTVSSITSTDGENSLNVTPGQIKQFTINYSASASPFSYNISASNVTIEQGSPGQSTVTKTLTGGTSEGVNISGTGYPSGVSASYAANQGCSPTCNGFVDLDIGAATPIGSYTITVNAESISTNVIDSDTFTLTVIAPPGPATATVAPNPINPRVNDPMTWTVTVLGATGPCTYVWSGTDIPVTAPSSSNVLNWTYQSVGTKNITVTASCGGLPIIGNGTVNVGVRPTFIEF